ncbi:hypothetical protein D9M69_506810 [compost metagenome]
MVGAVEEDQQVDVGVGVQLAAPVAADRQQGDVGVLAPGEAGPGLAEDLVDEPGAVLDQATDVAALAKARIEHFMGGTDGLLEGGDGAGLQGQLRLELAAVEKLGVNLRHRPSFYMGATQRGEVRAMVSSLRRVKIS